MTKQVDQDKTPNNPRQLYALVNKLMGRRPNGADFPFPRHATYADGREATDVLTEYLPMRKSKSTGKEAVQFNSAVQAELAKDTKLSKSERDELAAGIAAASDVNSDDWEDIKPTAVAAETPTAGGK